jgi:hypothetical protein
MADSSSAAASAICWQPLIVTPWRADNLDPGANVTLYASGEEPACYYREATFSRGTRRNAFSRSTFLRSSPLKIEATPFEWSAAVR